MDLSALLPVIDDAAGLDGVRARLTRGEAVTLGVSDGAKAAVLAALALAASRPIVVVTAKPQHAEALVDELASWLGAADGRRVLLFPERDALPYERLSPDPDDVLRRLDALDALAEKGPQGAVAEATGAPIIVACAQAVAQRTLTPDELRASTLALRRGGRIRTDELLRALDGGGYRFEPQITAPGEASRRGGIIDVWPPADDLPLRIELFGDEIESIRTFDVATQRSAGLRELARIGPARELIADASGARALAERMQPESLRGDARAHFARDVEQLRQGAPFAGDEFYTPFLCSGTLLDHLPDGALLIIDEPADIEAVQTEHDARADEARRDLEHRSELPAGMPEPHVPWPALRAAFRARTARLQLSRWATGDAEAGAPSPDGALRLPFGPVQAYGGRLRALADELTRKLRDGHQLVVVSTQSQRLTELLEEHDVFARETDIMPSPAMGSGALTMIHGSLPHGWSLGEDERGLIMLTDAEVFGFRKQRRALPRRGASRDAFLQELAPGDFVVHIEHGIAKFVGLTRRAVDEQDREYIELNYAEGDKLFVPTEQADRVSRYIGPSDHRPSLTRLGSQEWPRAKARVRRAVQQLAAELLRLYAQREVVEGHAFGPDTAWQAELEASFPYVETPDQVGVIREVKHDMEIVRPMDRLVCGDVGYGKTEIAVRAAFKAATDGYQSAVLVPTTVLAQQHFNTFRERLAGFPVKIEMLSRFRSDREQRHIVQDTAGGGVDILIGTHRLLQKDVQFHNLGLVIIDEEQRFGVAHKERLKQMRTEVDVLTLTATPIPRTLHMSLSGIRDMSTIETPPEERLPIKTYVSEFDDHLVKEAIQRELERGGQVYFVHNRVHNIELVARKLRDLVPEAQILIGHGQMPEDQLEQVMLDFTNGEADVLVCTTIIESGLDIPNVNTIIIHNADRFGLAQLYQLRGRVGRGAARAYAYLLYEKHRALSEPAQKRLQAIFEATELGAGFQIAMRDLEIRGAGNILGAEQSGQIGAVGFDLYVRLLSDAVSALRAVQQGETPPPSNIEAPLVIDLPLSAYIPESYISDLNMRLSLYQRMASAEGDDAPSDFERELNDRFGPPPPPVQHLLYIVRLRVLARRAVVTSVQREDAQDGANVITLRTRDGADFRALLPPVAQHALARIDGLKVGRERITLDIAAAGSRWRDVLLDVLETAAGAVPA